MESTEMRLRDEGSAHFLQDLAQDIRYTFRTLRRSPGFTLVVLLTLGVGIGATVAMFGVVNRTLFQALPFPGADRLVIGRTTWPDGDVGTWVSAPDYYDVRDGARSLEALSAFNPAFEATLTGGDEPRRVSAGRASPGFFRTLGVSVVRGRAFLPAEGVPGRPPVAIVSNSLWRDRYGGDPSLVGRTITLDGTPTTVVGILPAGFRFMEDVQVWRPMVRGEGAASNVRRFHNWMEVGRLAPGVSLEQAQSDVNLIMQRLAGAYPDSNKGMGMLLTPLRDYRIENARPVLFMLSGMILLVLLIACGNAAGLLLGRGATRGREMALRASLGARRGRLIRQLLAECGVLALGAGVLGTALALTLQRFLVVWIPVRSVGAGPAGGLIRVFGFALALSVGTVLLFGLAPALSTARVKLTEMLSGGGRGVASGHATKARSGLVVFQVALSVVLLVGAGLLARSFLQLQDVNPGFDARNLLTADLTLPGGTYDTPERRVDFLDRFLEEARSLPGVEAVGLIDKLPIRNGGGNPYVWNPEHPPADASHQTLAYTRSVTPGYFDAMRIPLLRGRDVRTSDGPRSSLVAVINETTASILYPGEPALGKSIAVDRGGKEPALLRIVGVVGDVKLEGLRSAAPMIVYLPYPQRPNSTMRIAARTTGRPVGVLGPLRDRLHRLDPEIPLSDPRAMSEVLSTSLAFNRRLSGAVGIFAAVALFLAGVGLYGILAYDVARRRQEIGVRMALGARLGQVVGAVLGKGLALVGIGLAFGVVGALAGGRVVRQFLFQVQAMDPTTYLAVALFLAAVGAAACLVPAWRAWRVDPVTALREE